MKLCFLGESHAAVTLREAARRKGFEITQFIRDAEVVFVSEDTPTDEHGVRDLELIRELIGVASASANGYVVVTSQVPPGFMRSLGDANLTHQAETLRMEDAMQRALYPEMLIVGYASVPDLLVGAYAKYLEAFDAPVLSMSYEDAEFTKMAINATLISQVENANRLSAAAAKCGADWQRVSRALRHDSRIGKYAYLTPGNPLASRHLLRDHVTLQSLA